MLKEIREKHFYKVFSVILLCLVLFICSMFASIYIEHIMEEHCFDVLEDTTMQGAGDIKLAMEGEQKEMQIIAQMLADHTTLNESTCKNYLSSLPEGNLTSSYSVLLPNNKMIYSNDKEKIVMDSNLKFNDVSLDEISLSKRFTYSKNKYIAYICPIKDGNNTRGILYGYIDLKDLSKKFSILAFDSECQLYLVDGNTGDFLMDTWHDTLGNIYDSSLSHRKTKKGVTFEQMKKDVAKEKSGYLVFQSKTTGDDFYTYYYPVGISKLTFQLTVPYKVAFADSIRVQYIVYTLSVIQIVVSILYVSWLIRKNQKQNKKNIKKLEISRTLNRIQQALLGAYKSPELVIESLESVANILDSKNLIFVVSDEKEIKSAYCYPTDSKISLKGKLINDDALQYYEKTINEDGILINDRDKINNITEFLEIDNNLLIENIAIVPIYDTQKKLIGSMNAFNVKDLENCINIMKTVAGGFWMSIQAIDAYKLIEHMGTTDALTGLKNRRAYQQDIEILERSSNEGLCCIYMDANGLHDLNNNYGHLAGDIMLCSIANEMKRLFGIEHSYRIGGDEFVIFCKNIDENEIINKIDRMKIELARKDYDISIGYAIYKPEHYVQNLISEAEKWMYEDKRKYYNGNSRDRRQNNHLNHNLEKILMEKEYQDNFLEVISKYFLGVYVVDLGLDDTKVIYKPGYFADLLEKNNYRFKSSVMQYAKEFIVEEDYDKFIDMLDYNEIASSMKKGLSIESVYHKTNSTIVRVRILPMKNYTETKKNTLWIFENI